MPSSQFKAFLQDALNILNDHVRNGYQFDYVIDEQVEFGAQSIQTFYRKRWRFYMLVRELSDEFLSTESATALTQDMSVDRRWQRFLKTLDGQPVTDPSVLEMSEVKRKVLAPFVENYVSEYEYGVFPTTVDDEKFRPIYSELIEATNETPFTRHVTLPLWNFSTDFEHLALDDSTSIRELSRSERQRLYNLVKTVCSFPLFGIDRVRYAIDVKLVTQTINNDASQLEKRASLALDALRIGSKGGVQAPLKFYSIEPANRWRSYGKASSTWSNTIVNFHPEYQLDQAGAQSMAELWNVLTTPEMEHSELLSRVRQRLGHMYLSSDPTDKIIDALVGLESIYLSSSDRTEIMYKLSLRVAAFLQDDLNDRRNLKLLIEILYNLRSKLVHGDQIKDKDRRFKGETLSIHQFSDKAEDTFRRTLLKVLVSQRHVLLQHDPKYFDDLLLK